MAKQAQLSELLPGGVNSPVRSFAGAGCTPIYAKTANGAYLTATNNQHYIDYIHGWGAVILGHAHPAITSAIKQQVTNGTSYGVTTELEYQFAKELSKRTKLPMSRAVNSGTEATMTAIRLARGYTKKDLLIKFAGCYHGHSDSLLVAAGSGALTFGKPTSAGVPNNTAKATLVLPYNDPQQVIDCFTKYGNKIAGVILEPIAGNMNLVIPNKEFIQTIAKQCKKYNALLISDEVMTGLRATPGLAITDYFQTKPDLACLGKVIGGGMPVAAVMGSKKIMQHLAPTGPVYQAGTLAGNPICLAAGLATLKQLTKHAYSKLNNSAKQLCQAFSNNNIQAQHVGGMVGFYLSGHLPSQLSDIEAINQKTFNKFHQAMLNNGVLLPPSKFEACFIGLSHNRNILKQTQQAIEQAVSQL